MKHKINDGLVSRMAISGNKIVTCDDFSKVIRVFNHSTCLLVVSYCFYMISYDTVEMIKQYREKNVRCWSLSLHGDVVYIGGHRFIVQWNALTDTIVRLEGYPGLAFSVSCPAFFNDNNNKIMLMLSMCQPTAVLWLGEVRA